MANVLARPLQGVNRILNARKRVTPETAVELAAALGTSPELWLNLENAYRLAQTKGVDRRILRRAERLLARAS